MVQRGLGSIAELVASGSLAHRDGNKRPGRPFGQQQTQEVLMAATQQRRTNRIVLALMSASLALLVWSDKIHAQDPATPKDHLDTKRIIAIGGLSHWLKARFSETELAALRPEDLDIESHYCGCYDKPKAHFPYSFFLLRTPKGDLVARPDSSEGALSFALLAVRYGDRYCEVESEADCYGSFEEPCDFTDFRYGPHLAEFFPTCKSPEVESAISPSGPDRSEP
jgi:hypothetical protein